MLNGMIKKPVTLLIIDDDQETLDLLKIAIERKGYFAHTASSWEETTETLDQLEKQDQKIDVIILDIMIPGRSGFDILRALHVILIPLPPVIILSAITGIEQQIHARDLGATKYLTKPTTPTKLTEAIDSALENS